MKGKFCVFCGKNPVNKNKEHIIPTWLINMTNSEGRKTITITNYKGERLQIPWNKFVFPACEVCNLNFGKIEEEVKVILENLSNEKNISHSQMNLFLDWLDKVRIGLWLSEIIHKKLKINPKFYINQRVGAKDRICLMYKISDNKKGISIFGSEYPVFHVIPSCFGLLINNFCFFSFSNDFLVSKNLGFPYPVGQQTMLDDGITYIGGINIGTSKVSDIIIPGEILKPSTRFYQSIYQGAHDLKKPLIGKKSNFFDDNGLVFTRNKIKSRIFIADDSTGFISFWPKKSNFIFKNIKTTNRLSIIFFMSKMVIEHQNLSAEKNFSICSTEIVNDLKQRISSNNELLSYLENRLKSLTKKDKTNFFGNN